MAGWDTSSVAGYEPCEPDDRDVSTESLIATLKQAGSWHCKEAARRLDIANEVSARNRELGKSEGYAQAVDDAVAAASDPARQPVNDRYAATIVASVIEAIAALKENRRA